MLSLDRQNQLRQQFRQINPEWQPATEIYARLVSQHLRPDSRLLDLGCGRGGLIEQLGHPLDMCTGLDPDLESLRQHRLRDGLSPLARVAGLSQQLPFNDRAIDLIFTSWVLEHLSQPEDDWRQIGRVLRPGGLFIFITPNKRHPLASLNRSLGRFSRLQGQLVFRFYGRKAVDSFPTYYRANTMADLRSLATSAGMRLTQLQTVPDPTYLAINPALFRLSCWLEARLPVERHIHLVGVAEKNSP